MPVPFIIDNYRDVDVPINWYPAADQDKDTILFGTPGLDTLITPRVDTEVRAFHAMGDFLYALCGADFYKIDSSWTATHLGTVSTSFGPAWIVDNGVQVAVCDGASMFVYKPSTGVYSLVLDADFPGASCLTYQDGYGAFINPSTQQFWLTALYDFTDIDATDYASAEGWPDTLSAIKMHYRELWLMGPETIEIWQNTGDSPFPFGRAPGGFIHQGIIAPGTLARLDNGLAWLNDKKQVLWAQGRQPTIISTAKMNREIDGYGDVTRATAFEYAEGGHTFLVMVFPENAVWIYDVATKVWHKRASLEGEAQSRWRGNCYIKWQDKHIVGDYANGKIYEMSREYLDDDGAKIIRTLYSQEIRNGGKPMFFDGLQILFNHGVATGVLDPQAMLSWSSDGGRTWSNEYWVSAGKIGEYNKRCRWWRLGMAEDHRIFKLQVSDAQKWDILSVDGIK